MVSLYDRLGGHVLKWSNLKGQQWGGATLPLQHDGEFFNIEIKVSLLKMQCDMPAKHVASSLNTWQLLNEAEQDMKNSADKGGCYPQNISYPTKGEFNNLLLYYSFKIFLKEVSLFRSMFFPLTKNNTTSSPGFLGQRFNNLQRVALLVSF